jgi:hypothetical protein
MRERKTPTKRAALPRTAPSAAVLVAQPLELTPVELRLLEAYRFTDDRGRDTIYACAIRQGDYPRHPRPLLRLITGGAT